MILQLGAGTAIHRCCRHLIYQKQGTEAADRELVNQFQRNHRAALVFHLVQAEVDTSQVADHSLAVHQSQVVDHNQVVLRPVVHQSRAIHRSQVGFRLVPLSIGH